MKTIRLWGCSSGDKKYEILNATKSLPVSYLRLSSSSTLIIRNFIKLQCHSGIMVKNQKWKGRNNNKKTWSRRLTVPRFPVVLASMIIDSFIFSMEVHVAKINFERNSTSVEWWYIQKGDNKGIEATRSESIKHETNAKKMLNSNTNMLRKIQIL